MKDPEMHDFVAAEIKRWADVIETAGVQRIEQAKE